MKDSDFSALKRNNTDVKDGTVNSEFLKMPIDILALKLEKFAGKFKALKAENDRLKAELAFYKNDSENSKNNFAENILLNKKHKMAILKIEKIIKKLESAGVL